MASGSPILSWPRSRRSTHQRDGKWAARLRPLAGAKSTAQILIRWALQHDLVVLPKSANRQRIVEDADVFDFAISADDMRTLDGFNENLRTCWDPTNAP